MPELAFFVLDAPFRAYSAQFHLITAGCLSSLDFVVVVAVVVVVVVGRCSASGQE